MILGCVVECLGWKMDTHELGWGERWLLECPARKRRRLDR
jgi:hypothetical protein